MPESGSGLDQSTKAKNPFALAGFVLGILSVFFHVFAILPTFAIVFSAIGLTKVKQTGSRKVFAWIGLILGSIYFLVAIVNLATGRW